MIKKKDNYKSVNLINRKSFLKFSSLSLLGLTQLGAMSLGGCKKSEANPEPNDNFNNGRLRIIEYNVFNGCIGYKGINARNLPSDKKYDLLKSARNLDQIPRRIVLQLALYHPDIISFCEGPDEERLKKMADWLGMNYVYFPSPLTEGDYPGAILTRFQIVSSENRPFVDQADNDPKKLFTRHWGKAKIRLLNGEMITVHSTHLWPFTKNGGLAIRLEEINQLSKSIRHDLDTGASSVLLQGDLNSKPSTEEHRILTSGGLIDTFDKVGEGIGYTANSKDPSTRIDYIYAGGEIAKKIVNSRPLYEGDFRLNNMDLKGFSLSDHIPVMTDFE